MLNRNASFVQRDPCPVCRNGKVKEYYTRAYSGGEVRDFLFRYYRLGELFSDETWLAKVEDTTYTLCECQRCRALYQKHAPDEDFSSEIYSKWIGRHHPRHPLYEMKEYVHWMTEAMELTDLMLRLKHLSSPSELHVLDYGMGHGIFLRAMSACGCRVWGYDFAENRQSAAAESGIATISLDDLRTMQFDFINTEQVFEHLPDPHRTGRLLAAALAPGGVLKISVPYNRWLDAGDLKIDWAAPRNGKHSYMPLQPLEHLNYFRSSTIETLAADLGLSPVVQSRQDLLRYAIGWTSPRRAVRNVGRALLREGTRNYHLLRKSVNGLPG